MSFEKTEVKMLMLQDLGLKLEKRRDTLELDGHKTKAAGAALRVAAKKIPGLAEHVDKDIDEGTIEKLIAEGPLAVAGYVKRRISQAAGAVANLAQGLENTAGRYEVQVEGMDISIKMIGKDLEAERKKLAGVLKVLERGEQAHQAGVEKAPATVIPINGPRPVGVHPGQSETQKRKAVAAQPSSPPPAEKKKASKKVLPVRKQRKCGKCGGLGHTVRTCAKRKKAQ